jgi:DNA helicase-2/ATP-dependent DNA helicase PcrA
MRSAWGQPSYNPPSRFLEEIPDAFVDWRRTGPATPSASASAASMVTTRPTGLGAGRTGPSGFATRRATERPVISLSVGDRVTHDQFGLGTVMSVTGSGRDAKATIDFGDEKPKVLLLRYAPVEKL